MPREQTKREAILRAVSSLPMLAAAIPRKTTAGLGQTSPPKWCYVNPLFFTSRHRFEVPLPDKNGWDMICDCLGKLTVEEVVLAIGLAQISRSYRSLHDSPPNQAHINLRFQIFEDLKHVVWLRPDAKPTGS